MKWFIPAIAALLPSTVNGRSALMPIRFLLLGWLAATVFAIGRFPKAGEAGRRLKPLWLLVLPWSLALLSGPFVIDHHAVGAAGRQWMICGQYAALVFLALVAAACVAWARGARQCAAAICFANLFPLVILVSASVMIIDPGS